MPPDSCLSSPSAADAPAPYSPLAFFGTWFGFGVSSFGGGNVALALIRRAAVDEKNWISEAEFTRNWALVQASPGINLLCLTILLGKRVDGARGIALALGGLLLPSASITILIAALYQRFASVGAVHAALQGVLPATVGMGIFTTYRMLMPPLVESRREGRLSFGAAAGIFAGSVAAEAVAGKRLPVVVLLLCAAGLLALFQWIDTFRRERKQGSEAERSAS